MKWMSELYMPVSRGKPGKIHDHGLACLIHGGYALWNPNDFSVILTPAGKRLYERAEHYLFAALEGFNPQSIDTGRSQRGALDAAVRTVRRAGDLPLFLMERKNDCLDLLGLHTDDAASRDMCRNVLREVGSAVCAFDIKLRRVDRLLADGYAVDIFCEANAANSSEDGFICSGCGWLACADTPSRRGAGECERSPRQPLACTPTPGASTIEELCAFFHITPAQTVKCMFYAAEGRGLVAVLLRGDRQVCLEKVRAVLGGCPIRPAENTELSAIMGDSAGYLGPIGLPATVTLIADYSVEGIENAVIGANKAGHHYTGACWERDFTAPLTADLSLTQEGDLCPLCGTPVKSGILRRIARFRPADPTCAAEPSLTFFNGQNKLHIPAWSAQINLTDFLAAVVENNQYLPPELAPFDTCLFWDGETPPTPLSPIVEALKKNGNTVLAFDRPGVLQEKAALVSALMLPRTVFLTKQDNVFLAKIDENGQKRQLTIADFLTSLS